MLEVVPNRPSYCVSHPLPALRCPRTSLSDREIFSIPSHSRSAAIAMAIPTIERWRPAIGRRRKGGNRSATAREKEFPYSALSCRWDS